MSSTDCFICKYKKKTRVSIYHEKYIVIKDGYIKVFKNQNEYHQEVQPSVTLFLLKAKVTMKQESKKTHVISIIINNNCHLFQFSSNSECKIHYKSIINHREHNKISMPLIETKTNLIDEYQGQDIKSMMKKKLMNRISNTLSKQQSTSNTLTPNRFMTPEVNTMTPDSSVAHDDETHETKHLQPYRGSVTSKSPLTMTEFFKETSNDINHDEIKYNMPPISEDIAVLRSQNSILSDDGQDYKLDYDQISLISFMSHSTKYGEQYTNRKRSKSYINISASTIKTHSGYYKFDDGVITVANIIQQASSENNNKMKLQCKLIGCEGSHLRQPFDIEIKDKRLCELDKSKIMTSHLNVWEKWLIILDAKYKYQSVYDGEPFKNMVSAVKRHLQLLFTIRYDNYKTKMQDKKHDHVIKSLFSYLLSIRCQTHGKLKLDCNCNNASLFTQYSYYLLMAVFEDNKRNSKNKNILKFLKNKKQNTQKTATQICCLLPETLQKESYFYEYQKCIEEWIDFDFHTVLCSKCGCLNNSIMINRIFHYAVKSQGCRICGFYDIVICNNKSPMVPPIKKQVKDFYEDSERKEGAGLDTLFNAEQYINYETGHFIRYHVLCPRFESLIKECTLNDIWPINKIKFSEYLSNAQKCHDKISSIVVATNNCIEYGIVRYAPIDVAHILVLIIYTEEIYYSQCFTKSFLSLNCTDSEIIIKAHCNNWYWFGRGIFEAIEFFGESFDGYSEQKLYQGSIMLFNFDSFAFPINFPRSIAVLESTAKQFAGNTGITVELIPKYNSELNRIKCINPCLVSKEYDQEMRLLFGHHGAVQIQDIKIGAIKNHSLQKYITALCYLEKILSETIFDTSFYNALHLYDDKNKIQFILIQLIRICVDLYKINFSSIAVKGIINKYLPSKENDKGIMYIIDIMRYWCEKTTFVTFEAFQIENDDTQNELIEFFIDIKSKQINIDNLRLLLPNLKCFRNYYNQVQFVSNVYFDQKQSDIDDVKYEENNGCETIPQVLAGAAKHEVPNLVYNALNKISSFQFEHKSLESQSTRRIERGKRDSIDVIQTTLRASSLEEIMSQEFKLKCKEDLMAFHAPISKSVEATLEDFIDVANKIDWIDEKTGKELSEHLYKTLLSDTERIKPWQCNHCRFVNRKMMVGGYFRFYNRLNSCGLCAYLRIRNKCGNDIKIKQHNKGNIIIEKPTNSALKLPYIVNHWNKIKKKNECKFESNQVYLGSYNVTDMIILLKKTICDINSSILNDNEDKIVEYCQNEQLDGRAFIAMGKKQFATTLSDKLQNKKTMAKLNKCYAKIIQKNISCNAMKRIALILEHFGGLTKSLRHKNGRYPYRWRKFISELENYGNNQLVEDVQHIFGHNQSFEYFFIQQPYIKCTEDDSKCIHVKRTQRQKNIHESLVQKQKRYYCDDSKDFVYIKYLDAVHSAILHNVYNNRRLHQSGYIIKKYGTHKIYQTGVLIQYDALSPLYCTLKDEMVNSSVYKVSETDFEDFIRESHKNMESEKWKEKSKNLVSTTTDERYGVKIGDHLCIEHVICITAYCSRSVLCRKFRESYWVNDYDDNNTIIKTYHSNYFYWLGRFIHIAITFFGTTPIKRQKNIKETFYHGLYEKFLFNEFSCYFEIPTSTTTNQNIAKNNFTNGGVGIVLELAPRFNEPNLSKYLDVSIMSGYERENERLFSGTTNILAIVDIQFAAGRKWFKSKDYCEMFLYFERITEQTIFTKDFYNYGTIQKDGKVAIENDIKKIKKLQETHLFPLIEHQMNRNRINIINPITNDNIQPELLYIYALFEHFCDEKRDYINLTCIQQEIPFMSDKIKNILFETEETMSFLEETNELRNINEESLKLIFPNLKSYKNHLNEWKTLIRHIDDESILMSPSTKIEEFKHDNLEIIIPEQSKDGNKNITGYTKTKIDEYNDKYINKIKIAFKSISNKPNIEHKISENTKTKSNENTPTTMDSLFYDLDVAYEGIQINEKKQSENDRKHQQFMSIKTKEDIERIINNSNDKTKDQARNYWYIGKKVAEYFNKIFNDNNTVVIVSEKNKLPEISNNHFSVQNFKQYLHDHEGDLCGLDIMIYRTIGHQSLNKKYKENTKGYSFQEIVLGLSGAYDNPNKIANELTKIYGYGCHVTRATHYAYSYNVYCRFNKGLIARAEFESNSAFVVAWRR